VLRGFPSVDSNQFFWGFIKYSRDVQSRVENVRVDQCLQDENKFKPTEVAQKWECFDHLNHNVVVCVVFIGHFNLNTHSTEYQETSSYDLLGKMLVTLYENKHDEDIH
jgi:hypothetical protein